MKIDGLSHPKTKELAYALEIPLPHAIGLLELTWAFVGQQTPQGNIGKWSNAVIAGEAGWHDDADLFVEALVSVGFLDECSTNRLIVHDWADHAPNWVHAKLKKKGKSILSADLRTGQDNDLSNGLRGRYKPSLAKTSEKPMSGSGAPDDFLEERFNRARKIYPSRPNDNRKKGLKAYRATYRRGVDLDEVDAGIERYAAYCKAEQISPRFIKHMATFLGPDEHWKEDWKALGKVPDDPAELGRIAEENGVDLPDNCSMFDARKRVAQATGMAL